MSKQKYPQSSSSTTSTGESRGIRPVKKNGYSQIVANVTKNRKRTEAKERQAAYDKLTTAEKLAAIGKTGSVKQKAKLTAQLAKK